MSVLKVKQSDGTWEQVFGGGGSASADITVNNKAADDNGNITLEKSDVGIYTSSTEPTGAKDGDIWVNGEDDEAIKVLEGGSWVSLGGASNSLVVRLDNWETASHGVSEIKKAFDEGKTVMLLAYESDSDGAPLYYLDTVTETVAQFLRVHITTQGIHHDSLMIWDNGSIDCGNEVFPMLPEVPSDVSNHVLTANNGNLSWQIPTGGSGGAQVQPDWNQSDETAADFIKNKPFDLKISDTLYDADVEITNQDGMIGAELEQIFNYYNLNEDYTCIITIDEASYPSKIKTCNVFNSEMPCFGNLFIYGSLLMKMVNSDGSMTDEEAKAMILEYVGPEVLEDTGEPFLLMLVVEENASNILLESEKNIHLTIQEGILKQIDPIFIPSGIGGGGGGPTEWDQIRNKPEFSVDWNQTTEGNGYIYNKPKIQADWEQTDPQSDGYIHNKPNTEYNKNYVVLIDDSTNVEYKVYVKDGEFVFENVQDLFIDFEYVANEDGTYELTAWKGTLNGVASTECVIPNLRVVL